MTFVTNVEDHDSAYNVSKCKAISEACIFMWSFQLVGSLLMAPFTFAPGCVAVIKITPEFITWAQKNE